MYYILFRAVVYHVPEQRGSVLWANSDVNSAPGRHSLRRWLTSLNAFGDESVRNVTLCPARPSMIMEHVIVGTIAVVSGGAHP